MAAAAHVLTSGATGGSNRALRTLPSPPSQRWSVVLTTTVMPSGRGCSLMHARTAPATVFSASGSTAVGLDGNGAGPALEGAAGGSTTDSADGVAGRGFGAALTVGWASDADATGSRAGTAGLVAGVTWGSAAAGPKAVCGSRTADGSWVTVIVPRMSAAVNSACAGAVTSVPSTDPTRGARPTDTTPSLRSTVTFPASRATRRRVPCTATRDPSTS